MNSKLKSMAHQRNALHLKGLGVTPQKLQNDQSEWRIKLKRMRKKHPCLRMNCLVAVINGFVLISTGMRIIGFDFCVPVNTVCAIMSFWEADIEKFSAVINHVQ